MCADGGDMRDVPAPPDTRRAATVRRRDADVVELCWSGHITVDDVQQLRRSLAVLVAERPGRLVVVDTRAVSGFDVEARIAARPLLVDVRTHFQRMVVIAPSLLVRLAATGLSLACGVPLDIVPDAVGAENAARIFFAQPAPTTKTTTTATRTATRTATTTTAWTTATAAKTTATAAMTATTITPGATAAAATMATTAAATRATAVATPPAAPAPSTKPARAAARR